MLIWISIQINLWRKKTLSFILMTIAMLAFSVRLKFINWKFNQFLKIEPNEKKNPIIFYSNMKLFRSLAHLSQYLRNRFDTQDTVANYTVVHQNRKLNSQHFDRAFQFGPHFPIILQCIQLPHATNPQSVDWCKYFRCLRNISNVAQIFRPQPWKILSVTHKRRRERKKKQKKTNQSTNQQQ